MNDTTGRISNLIAFVTAIIAVFGLTYQIYFQRSEANEREVYEWQNAIVYKIIDNSNEEIEFDKIYSGYLSEAKNIESNKEFESKELTKNKLIKILLNLREKNIVGYNDGKYFILNNDDYLTGLLSKYFGRDFEMKRVDPIAYKKIKTSPGVFSESELYLEIKNTANTSLDDDEFSIIIESLVSRNRVIIKNKKLYPAKL